MVSVNLIFVAFLGSYSLTNGALTGLTVEILVPYDWLVDARFPLRDGRLATKKNERTVWSSHSIWFSAFQTCQSWLKNLSTRACLLSSQFSITLTPQLAREILAWTWIGKAERPFRLAAWMTAPRQTAVQLPHNVRR
jgi:hypothetical protein